MITPFLADWTAWIGPAAISAAFAIITFCFIAWPTRKLNERQANISKQNLRLALFDKRWNLFVLTRDFLNSLYDGHDHSTRVQNIEQYKRGMEKAIFLLPDDLKVLVNEVVKHAAILNEIEGRIEAAVRDGDEQRESKHRDEYTEEDKKTNDFGNKVHAAFDVLLNFRAIT